MGARTYPHAWLPILPVDLVIIMLGTNDLKPVFNRTPLRIALGAAHLIELVNTLNGGVGTTYKNPRILLICPPPLNPEIEKGPVFGKMFEGGVEKSQKLPELYEAVAKMGGADFLNAGSVVSTDGVDGLHPDRRIREKTWSSRRREGQRDREIGPGVQPRLRPSRGWRVGPAQAKLRPARNQFQTRCHSQLQNLA